MASREQRRKLLGVACSFCGAMPGEECTRSGPRGKRYPVSTLDGGCHDARWQKAGLGSAPVVAAAVEQIRARSSEQPAPVKKGEKFDVDREPVPVGAAMPALDRPW